MVVKIANFLKACYSQRRISRWKFIISMSMLVFWTCIMVLYPRLLLDIMPMWFPFAIDSVIGILAFYMLTRMTIELISN
jgi:hypothetical protein